LPPERLGKPFLGVLPGLTRGSQISLDGSQGLFNGLLVSFAAIRRLVPSNMLVRQLGLKVSNRLVSGG
jgi:hypothetical protein